MSILTYKMYMLSVMNDENWASVYFVSTSPHFHTSYIYIYIELYCWASYAVCMYETKEGPHTVLKPAWSMITQKWHRNETKGVHNRANLPLCFCQFKPRCEIQSQNSELLLDKTHKGFF